ncbi:MAG: hypothetical protein ACR2QC_11875 [Gammaproteobacteria bacterium]
MPIPTQQKQSQREALGGFLGVNLRRDRLSLEDSDVARAINVDFHQKPGTAILRLGRSAQFSTSLGATIRRLAKHNGNRFQIAGTSIYENQTSFLSGLSGNLFTTLQPFRTLGDDTEWTYIADDNLMRAYDGATVRNWGIAPPTTAMTVSLVPSAGQPMLGDYSYVYTFVRVKNGAVATESDPSPVSNTLALTPSFFVFASILEASTDPQVTNINVYRTAGNGGTHLFLQQRSNTVDVFNDAAADGTLGIAAENDNEVPNNMSWVREFQGHLFMCRDALNPHYLWWSKRFREEVPSSNFVEIGHPSDPLLGALSLSGLLGVFTRETKYRVVGNDTSGFVPLESLSKRGTPAVQAAIVTSNGVLFPARDGIFLTNFLERDTPLAQEIESLFYEITVNDYAPIDWSRANEMAMAEYKDRFYFSYPEVGGGSGMAVFSTDTRKWYFYDYGRAYHAMLTEEDVDDLVAGGPSGTVDIIEDAATASDAGTSIAMTFEPATRVGRDRFVTKLFQYVRADIDAKGSVVDISVYVDAALIRTYSISGSRTRRLLRLPSRLLGSEWRMTVSYTGSERIEVYALHMQYMPLRFA